MQEQLLGQRFRHLQTEGITWASQQSFTNASQ